MRTLAVPEDLAKKIVDHVDHAHYCERNNINATSRACTCGCDSIKDNLRALLAAPGVEEPDKARMDWMEREAHDLIWDDTRPGVLRASDGAEFFAETLRDAVDLALGDETPAPEER